jgi:hypothetical protein
MTKYLLGQEQTSGYSPARNRKHFGCLAAVPGNEIRLLIIQMMALEVLSEELGSGQFATANITLLNTENTYLLKEGKLVVEIPVMKVILKKA